MWPVSLYPECGFIIIALKKCTFHCNNIYVWGQYDFFLEEINTFIQQGRLIVIKSDSEDSYNATKDFYFI